MAYATIDTVFARYRPISTMVGSSDLDVPSVDVSTVFIAGAENFMNAFLAARYVVPVTTEPLVTELSADITIFNMMAERNGRVPEFMQTRYDRSLEILKALRDGEMRLISASTQLVSSGDSFAWSSTGSYHSIFGVTLHEADQKVDSLQVCDELGERGIDC